MSDSKQHKGGESCTTAALDQVLELNSEFNGTRYYDQAKKCNPILRWSMEALFTCMLIALAHGYYCAKPSGVDSSPMWFIVFAIPMFVVAVFMLTTAPPASD